MDAGEEEVVFAGVEVVHMRKVGVVVVVHAFFAGVLDAGAFNGAGTQVLILEAKD